MTSASPPAMAPEERRQLEELYRQQISAVRTLARLLGYPCPIARRDERACTDTRSVDDRVILTFDS